MDKNAKFTIAAVAFLVLSSFTVFWFSKIEASTDSSGSSIIQTEKRTELFPLKIGSWNSIKVPWNVSALKAIGIEKGDETVSIEAAAESGIIEPGVLLSDDSDRVLGLENEILSGQVIRVFVNESEAKKLNIIFER